jgi:HTH-like domain
VLCKGITVKYAWIAKNKAVWPISLMCEVLGVSVSGYFEHQSRSTQAAVPAPESKHTGREALLAHIRAIHAEVKGEYGWPRLWKELLARGIRVGKQRVQRLMKLHGIKARGKRKFAEDIGRGHWGHRGHWGQKTLGSGLDIGVRPQYCSHRATIRSG